ncbi:MAG: PQQ-dependent sugar dehydrogenase [Pirellulaceae bacterium]|nr:PQQ-dependent sugar dehydrogenase [Pirellulaceae bacterium]
MNIFRRIHPLAMSAFCLMACCGNVVAERLGWTTSRIHGSPDPPSRYQTEIAFPNLQFDEPVAMTFVPGSNRMVVVQRFGKIYTFENDPSVEKAELFFDLPQALGVDRAEAFGIAFHPKFVENGRLFIHHNRGDQKLPTRVSSFLRRDQNQWQVDPTSEKLLIAWPGGHNGGCVKFGQDGYLYISNGDRGGLHDSYQVGQTVNNLQASILRIDIDVADGELPYRIPADNPFVEIETARHEVWAYGLRNAWKFSFDRKTGDLWAADVGEDLWESVHKIERGGNYGWSVEEGGRPFRPARQRGPTPIQKPVVAHDHSEARSITGGFVYRGQQNTELIGHYIYGDYDTGIIWGLGYDGKNVTFHEELSDTNLRLVGFAEDHEGELFLIDHIGGYIHKLVVNERPDVSAVFPRQLSETGLFASTAELIPETGVIPYSVIAPQWCDGATKQRYMALPNAGQIEFEAVRFPFRGGRDGWKFPDGTVLVETHFLAMEQDNPLSQRRMETRILHHERLPGSENVGDQLWRGYTYVWNDDQTDADLLVDTRGFDRQFTIRDPAWPEGERKQTWHFPGRTECSSCHTMAAKYVLGCQTMQTNHTREYAGETSNQLDYFQQLGLFAEPLPKPVAEMPSLVDYRDDSQKLAKRARSYLHANCSHCHRNGGGGNSDFFALASLKFDQLKMLNASPRHGSFHVPAAKIVLAGNPFKSMVYYRMSSLGSGRMPRLGSTVVDDAGVDLIYEWIKSIEPTIDPDTGLETTVGALHLVRLIERGDLSGDSAQRIIEQAVTKEPHIRDLFERFLPESKRSKRLGSSIDPPAILQLNGDASHGQRMFFEQSGVQCKSCHRIGGRGMAVGPDLDQIGKKYNRSQLLESILEPSKKIDAEYLQYQCITNDGKSYTGVLSEKTDEFVILQDGKAQSHKIERANIEELVSLSTSLMPELLVRDMTAQQVADLVAYLGSLRNDTSLPSDRSSEN